MDGIDRVEVAKVVRSSAVEVIVEMADELSDEFRFRLYIRSDPTTVPRALLRYLESCVSPGLGITLAGHGMLTAGDPVDAPILNDGQRKAVGSIMAPGVGLIWGPPGTGKTRAIGHGSAATDAGP